MHDCQLLAEMNKDVHELHVKLYPEVFKPYHYNEMLNFFIKMVSDENFSAYVAVVNKKVVGYIIIRIINEAESAFKYASQFIYIDQLFVKENYRKQGIAGQLLQKAENIAAELNISNIEIHHWYKNTAAANFFSNSGFRYSKMGMGKTLRQDLNK